MAPIVQAVAAACFAALCSVRTAFALPKAVAAAEEAYTSINLARRGRMTVLVPMVTQTAAIVQEVVQALPDIAGEDCASVTTGLNAVTVKGFFVGFSGSPNYRKMVQEALTTGLAGIKNQYPEQPWGQGEWTSNNVVANIGFLLNSQSTQVGCGVTEDCSATNVMLCRFLPAPQEGQQPFSKEYYSALMARTSTLEEMSPSDVNPDGSGATASVPTLLLAAFAGLMAFASI